MYIFLFHSHCFHWVTVKSILYFLIKKQLSWRKIGMLLAWLTHKTLALSFPCASSNTSNSIVNHHKTNPYLSSPCHLEFQTSFAEKPVYKLYFKKQHLTLQIPFTYFWSACQAFSVSFIWSAYSIQDAGVLWIYTASQYTVWFFIPFLIISTNLFSFWSWQPTELVFSSN